MMIYYAALSRHGTKWNKKPIAQSLQINPISEHGIIIQIMSTATAHLKWSSRTGWSIYAFITM